MPVIMNPSLLPTLATLRDLLDILAALRGASNPFGSLDGLRSAIALIVRLGTTLQINPKWLAWLQSAECAPPRPMSKRCRRPAGQACDI